MVAILGMTVLMVPGADRGAGAQDGHWDPEDPNDNRRWDRGGNLLPSTPQMDSWAVAGTIVNSCRTDLYIYLWCTYFNIIVK